MYNCVMLGRGTITLRSAFRAGSAEDLRNMAWKRACAFPFFCAAMAMVSPAQTFTTLVSFDLDNGAGPFYAPLVQATNGDLYGTTQIGGAHGAGTIFEITPAGVLTTLHNFRKPDPINGYGPLAALVQATNGDLYGTTGSGGGAGAVAYGTIVKITPAGVLTTLHNFDLTDGAGPYAGLVQAANGNLYGTTLGGGANYTCGADNGCGTIFKITPAGVLTTLHSFDSTDGANPGAGLVQAANGDLYGTTLRGGANNICEFGCGTIFKITPAGVLTTLHNFDLTDGAGPNALLVQATDGNLYGTTTGGGANNLGTSFKITLSGKLTTLHSFDGTDGSDPQSGLVQATDGNLYGTTLGGGANYTCGPEADNGCGTIFKITPAGVLTTLHSFDSIDGANPWDELMQATNGDLYGTTYQGGASNYGTIFSISVGLGPFVKTLPTSGAVGSVVKILGMDLTGSTSVSFNGTGAVFTVVSPTLITTIVPAGATTGTIQVITPSGTLVTNVAFRVP
jgi:uncharacterized repeat protein (TIGR03803 family)